MKNKILLFIGLVIFYACSQKRFSDNQIENLGKTLSYLSTTNENLRNKIEHTIINITHHHRKNPYKTNLEAEMKNFMEFSRKNIGFIYKYDQEISKKANGLQDPEQKPTNAYHNALQEKTLITHQKSNEIANMLILHLEYLQKNYQNIRADTLFKGFLKKENRQDFFYEYYFENTSVVESLISLEEIKFVLLQQEEECLYAISEKYLEKANLTRIEILNKKQKYQIGDTILLGLKGENPKIKTLVKAYIKPTPFDKFPNNIWYYVVPKDIHIGKNDLYTSAKCIKADQTDTILSRKFVFEVNK